MRKQLNWGHFLPPGLMFLRILPAREVSRPFSRYSPDTSPGEEVCLWGSPRRGSLPVGLSLVLSAQPVICVLRGDTEPTPAEKTCFAQVYLWLGKYACLILGWNINKSFWFKGLPYNSADKESACNAGDPFNSWVGKSHWRRERLPTPVFRPGEFHGLYSPWSRKELDMTERLSLSLDLRFEAKSTLTVYQQES